MGVDERALERLDELIKLGDSVRATRRRPKPGHITSDFVDVDVATQWIVGVAALLEAILGAESAYARRLEPHLSNSPKWPDVQQVYGILLAAKDEVAKGGLLSVRNLIEAEVFDDFLEQSEHLLGSGYHAPAAVIAGAVLEDGLRKLCVRNAVSLPAKPKLDSMNSDLAKAGVYTKLTQRKVTALADIRNSAAHGDWEAFESSDVESMIRDVRDFMVRHLS